MCVDCGGRVDGASGNVPEVPRCRACSPAANRKWTKETIIAAIEAEHERTGRRPVSTDWLRERPDGIDRPYTASVLYVFGTWNAAMEAAGFQPIPASRPIPGILTPDAVDEIVQQHRAGVSPGKLADEHGVSSTAITYWLRKRGEPTVPRGALPGNASAAERAAFLQQVRDERAQWEAAA